MGRGTGDWGSKETECSQLKCKCKSKSSLVHKRKETAPGKLAAQTTKWLLHCTATNKKAENAMGDGNRSRGGEKRGEKLQNGNANKYS